MAGALVAVEGIDGSGLTTHSRLLAQSLTSVGIRSVYTKEPTEGPLGQVIRSQLAEPSPDPTLMALLFAADRAWHLRSDPSLPGGKGVLGAIEQDYVVVCDRYKYSSIAYQGAAGVSQDWLWSLNSFAREADIIVYIDVPVDVALSRITERPRREAYERTDFLLRVKAKFDEVLRRAAEMGVRVVKVSGVKDGEERPIGEVSQEILRAVVELLRSFS
ncbi:MAG: dTMP kinase [Acidilobus sp.]